MSKSTTKVIYTFLDWSFNPKLHFISPCWFFTVGNFNSTHYFPLKWLKRSLCEPVHECLQQFLCNRKRWTTKTVSDVDPTDLLCFENCPFQSLFCYLRINFLVSDRVMSRRQVLTSRRKQFHNANYVEVWVLFFFFFFSFWASDLDT